VTNSDQRLREFIGVERASFAVEWFMQVCEEFETVAQEVCFESEN
jgi:hypothetical protein